MLVYGVDKKPKFQTIFFSRHIDIIVPDSGIIFTSNQSANSFMNNLVIIDSVQETKRELKPGFGIRFAMDTLRCGN